MIQGGWVVSSAVAFMHLKGKEDRDRSQATKLEGVRVMYVWWGSGST